jgi:hypothetical protein
LSFGARFGTQPSKIVHADRVLLEVGRRHHAVLATAGELSCVTTAALHASASSTPAVMALVLLTGSLGILLGLLS